MTEAPRPTETPMPKVQLGYGARVEIDNDADLHLRPATASSVIGSVHAGPVEIEIMDDDTVSPMLGPVEADGLIWYPVRSHEGPFGWLGLDASTWEPMAPDCPTSTGPSVEEFLSMAPAERVACFGDQPMSFTAAVALSGLGGLSLASFEPDWLASRLTTNMRVSSASGVTLSAPLHLAPGLSLPDLPPGSTNPYALLDLVVHVADPAAEDCLITAPGASGPEDHGATVAYCRAQIVATEFAFAE